MKLLATLAPLWLLLNAPPAVGQLPLPPGGDLQLPARRAAPQILQVRVVASHTQVAPGLTFHVALDLRIADGWVYYSPAPGGNGPIKPQPAKITVKAEGLEVGPIRWPPHESYRYSLGGGPLTNNVYKGRAVVYVPVTVPAGAEPGARRLGIAFDGQVCGEGVCMDVRDPDPVTARASATVAAVAAANPQWDSDPKIRDGLKEAKTASQLAAQVRARAAAEPPGLAALGGSSLTIWGGLGLAVLAGLILNIMPCVLPVIPLRILSIVQMAHESRRRFITLGLAFAGGVLLFFVGLGAVNVAVRTATDRAVNVSQHFRYAPVRIAIALVLVALAANLFGVFHVVVPSRVAALGEGRRKREGHLKSLGMGFMMAVLATPCSFAVLATALAWAQLQPTWLGSVALVLIGIGMAAPHAVLVLFPGLLRKIPRPGRWMELFKQAMGFVLLPVVVWLLSTLSENSYPFWVAGYAVVLVFALWMWAHWVRYDAPWRRKLIVRGLAVALAVAGGVWMLRPARPLATKFVPYDPAQIAEARENGQAVLLKFTAGWCTSCISVDYAVYDNKDVAREIKDRNVLAVKADVTNRGSPAARLLYKQFRGSPPLTVIYPPGAGARPIGLVGKFAAAKLMEILKRIAPVPPDP